MNAVYSTKKYNRLPTNKIVFFEAAVNYTLIHLDNGQKITSSYTLMFFERSLKEKPFIRVNKSYLLNSAYITDFIWEKESGYILLLNGLKFQIARRRRNLIRQIGHFSTNSV